LLEVVEVVGAGYLLDPAGGPHLVDLDAELADLLAQEVLAGGDLAGHLLEDPGQLAEGIGPPPDVVQAAEVEGPGLQRTGRVGHMADLVDVLDHLVEEPGVVDGAGDLAGHGLGQGDLAGREGTLGDRRVEGQGADGLAPHQEGDEEQASRPPVPHGLGQVVDRPVPVGAGEHDRRRVPGQLRQQRAVIEANL
jgi:hypothetical protein